VDLKTLNDDQITRQYQWRFSIGAIAIVLLAFPAAYHSYQAISNLFNRPSDWIPADMPVRVEFDDFARRFSVTDLLLVSWDGADLDSAQLDNATKLLQPLTIESSTRDATPMQEAGDKNTADDGDDGKENVIRVSAAQSISKLLDELDEKPLHWARSGTEILAQMTGSPANLPRASAVKRLSGSIVGPDNQQTCLVISLTEIGLQKRRSVLATIRQALSQQLGISQSEIAIAGGPNDGTVIDDASIRSVQTFSPPSAILAALLCFLCLRSFVLTIAITIVAVIGEGLVLAAVYYSGSPMNAVLIVLPPLVFVLTISSGIHLSNYYLDALREFPEATRAQAAAIAMRAGTTPCLVAASTTIVGLGSLLLVRLEPIRIFGAVASLGLMVTLALLLLILPGAMLLYGGPRQVSDRQLLLGAQAAVPPSRTRRRFRIFLRRILQYPVAIILGFVIGTTALGTGLLELNTSINLPRMFDANHPLRTQYDWFETNIGPTINGELLLRFPAKELGQDAIDRLELVKEVHIAIARSEDVGGVLSAVSFLPAVPKGRGVSATASRSVIRAQLIDPESSVGKLGYISRDNAAEVWRISFRLPMTTKTDYAREIDAVGIAATDAIQKVVEEEKTASTMPDVVLTGAVKVTQEAQEILLHDLFTSFISAFAIVAVVMILLLRNIAGGLLAMIPNLFPTIALFGYMGLSDVPLDIGSVMTASVALGIAVDDTIHLLSRFSSRTARGITRKHAAWGAIQQCGMAMVHTTMVCGLSLLVYTMSEFVPTRRFAFLMFGLLAMALLGDLLLLPALMVSRIGYLLTKPVMADSDAGLTNPKRDAAHIDVRRLPFARKNRNSGAIYSGQSQKDS